MKDTNDMHPSLKHAFNIRRTSRLPVIYVFGRKKIDVELCVQKITEYVISAAEDIKDIDYIEVRHEVSLTYLASKGFLYLLQTSKLNAISLQTN